MLGAIIGDIIGSRWEFCPTNDYHFEWISAQNDYTDDTLCTVAVADAIVHQSDDYGSYIHCWCRSHPCPMGGYGGVILLEGLLVDICHDRFLQLTAFLFPVYHNCICKFNKSTSETLFFALKLDFLRIQIAKEGGMKYNKANPSAWSLHARTLRRTLVEEEQSKR